MVKDAGKGRISCSFNATIYPDTVKDIPLLTQWAQEHIHLVQTMVFILFRLAQVNPSFNYFVGGRQIDPSEAEYLRYDKDFTAKHHDVTAQEVVDKIREVSPDYEPGAFLNSNQDGGAVKWLLAMRAGRPEKILGYLDGKIFELSQAFHHLLFGTYLAYTRPWAMQCVPSLFPLAAINRTVRSVFKNWISEPGKLFEKLSLQTILVLQPPDVLADGRQAMCDGCPDTIYYKGRLLWKCRLDEIQKFGDFIQSAPKEAAQSEEDKEDLKVASR
jgi:hypothetical protein